MTYPTLARSPLHRHLRPSVSFASPPFRCARPATRPRHVDLHHVDESTPTLHRLSLITSRFVKW